MENKYKSYMITCLSAFVIEICSTAYIKYVAERDSIGMIVFAAIGPFLSLPFVGYLIDSKNWMERLYLAITMSVGYVLGSLFVILFLK